MLYVPFAVFLLNSVFHHVAAYDQVFDSKEACMDQVTIALARAQESMPEGGTITGGCLTLPERTKAPSREPKPMASQKEVTTL